MSATRSERWLTPPPCSAGRFARCRWPPDNWRIAWDWTAPPISRRRATPLPKRKSRKYCSPCAAPGCPCRRLARRSPVGWTAPTGRASRAGSTPAPAIDQVAAASGEAISPPAIADFPPWPPLPLHPTAAGTAQLIRQRRSAQRFDPKCSLAKASFYRLLDALLPRPQAPWPAHPTPPRIHLLLFVLRVDGLPSGLYLLPRNPEAAPDLA